MLYSRDMGGISTKEVLVKPRERELHCSMTIWTIKRELNNYPKTRWNRYNATVSRAVSKWTNENDDSIVSWETSTEEFLLAGDALLSDMMLRHLAELIVHEWYWPLTFTSQSRNAGSFMYHLIDHRIFRVTPETLATSNIRSHTRNQTEPHDNHQSCEQVIASGCAAHPLCKEEWEGTLNHRPTIRRSPKEPPPHCETKVVSEAEGTRKAMDQLTTLLHPRKPTPLGTVGTPRPSRSYYSPLR